VPMAFSERATRVGCVAREGAGGRGARAASRWTKGDARGGGAGGGGGGEATGRASIGLGDVAGSAQGERRGERRASEGGATEEHRALIYTRERRGRDDDAHLDYPGAPPCPRP
jgi:hypothetical protein